MRLGPSPLPDIAPPKEGRPRAAGRRGWTAVGRTALLAGLVWSAAGSGSTAGAAAEPTLPTANSVFFVAKSENKNQVHYGIRLDEQCAPVGDSPVFAYWRMLERSASATEPLLARELPAYGLGSQRRALGPTESRVFVTLRALPGRTIEVDVSRTAAGCRVRAEASIGGVPAQLRSVFVQLRWPFGVDYLLLDGRADADGRWVRERVSP